jgi:hypothetical protein
MLTPQSILRTELTDIARANRRASGHQNVILQQHLSGLAKMKRAPVAQRLIKGLKRRYDKTADVVAAVAESLEEFLAHNFIKQMPGV